MAATTVVPTAYDGTTSPAVREEPAPGVLLKSYRLSLRSIDWTGRTVGGTAIGSFRVLGLPRDRTEQLARARVVCVTAQPPADTAAAADQVRSEVCFCVCFNNLCFYLLCQSVGGASQGGDCLGGFARVRIMCMLCGRLG